MCIFSVLQRPLPVLYALVVGLFIWIAPTIAGAHATLVEVEPAPNSQFIESPSIVKLSFNEQIDQGLYYIHVYNQSGRKVTSAETQLNAMKTGIELDLPKLDPGVYVVSYHVISLDGHPISGSYPITVGSLSISEEEPILPGLSTHEHSGTGAFSISMMTQYITRAFWYLTMTALVGWLIWLRWVPVSISRNPYYRQHILLQLQRGHFIGLLFVVFTHMEDLLGRNNISEVLTVFTSTGVGISWLGMLIASLVGFFVLGRTWIIDLTWIIAYIAAKSISGHAISFSPQWVTVGLDIIHLCAAALWVSGLIFVWIAWRRREADRLELFQRFSRVALISIAVLSVSGVLTLWFFLPSLIYLTYSMWGLSVLIKVGFVLLIICIATGLRTFISREREQTVRLLLKVDIIGMLAIMILVGFMTYAAPLPANEKLNWHVMGEEIHMTADITPKVQGTNTFQVKVWLSEMRGKPKEVQMILKYQDQANMAAIRVPIAVYEDSAFEESFGMVKHSYQAVGPYLPFRGKYQLEIRVMDLENNETVYQQDLIVY